MSWYIDPILRTKGNAEIFGTVREPVCVLIQIRILAKRKGRGQNHGQIPEWLAYFSWPPAVSPSRLQVIDRSKDSLSKRSERVFENAKLVYQQPHDRPWSRDPVLKHLNLPSTIVSTTVFFFYFLAQLIIFRCTIHFLKEAKGAQQANCHINGLTHK